MVGGRHPPSVVHAIPVAIEEHPWRDSREWEFFNPAGLMVPHLRDGYHSREKGNNQQDVDVEYHHTVETPDRGTPAFHQTSQAATPTSAPLLCSLPYSSLPGRSAGGGNPSLRTIESPDFNSSLVESTLCCLGVAYVHSLNHPDPTSLVQALAWTAEMIPRYCAYRLAHYQVQKFCRRFQSTVYRIATELPPFCFRCSAWRFRFPPELSSLFMF